jgi:hypothetical protein
VREESTSQLHTYLEGRLIEENRKFFEWGGGTSVGTTMLGVVGLSAAASTHAAAFFLGFAAAGLGAAACLGSGLLFLAVFLVAPF